MADVKVIDIFSPGRSGRVELPLFLESVSAGFPSPADDYMEGRLDLNDFLVKNPAATFFVRVTGDSMINAGIHSGDILVVDRALDPKDGNIVIAVINGELTVKRLSRLKNKLFLLPENREYRPIEITSEMNFEVWGVVRTVIHSVI
ncbi:MAG: LexA family protein [Candidatus Kapaibacterium sp.]